MNEDSRSRIEPFEADLSHLIGCKMEFLSEANDFVFFRKGEAAGALEVAMYAARLIDPSLLSSASFIAIVGAHAAALAGGAAAVNKSWEVALKQFDLFFANVDATKGIFQRLVAKIHDSGEPASTSSLPPDIRVLCTRNEQNELAIPLLMAMGARIRHRSNSADAGSHRFHLNESRFAFHVRMPKDRFIGVTGTNDAMRERLRTEFLVEWEQSGLDVRS